MVTSGNLDLELDTEFEKNTEGVFINWVTVKIEGLVE